MAREYKDVVVGLDIGTAKVMAVVAEVLPSGELKLAGLGVAPSNGLKRGVVVNIDRQPVVNGYLSDANRARVAGSSYLQVVPSGSGNVVLFADDPAHRKYWHGTERLLLNALLQGNHLNTPKQRGE